ncbi:maleylpyruvate isomerase family mycothiol-dependent enzyme [Planobispora siamensis]|uniref:Maleylpyruvate isomerase n=1 Tax=Planobispora siamensis TaxID=936338 RepID=A0A8J3WNI0_9ACTN|nr:maleylpyruvate isomerase family mycothiol-dependent enzyme [Planobispora siamensis]GIH94487.1 maleylpyruvate isomerase [Planobispora siamensis]
MTVNDLAARVLDGQRRLEDLIAGLTDEDVRAPSALPDWSRGHVITHLEQNTAAFTRQTEYARRGELIDVYDGGAAGRAAAIERGAGRGAEELRTALAEAHAALAQAWTRVGEDDWRRPVRYRDATLLDTVYARWREVEIHMADLDLGYRPSDWPLDFCDHIVDFLGVRVPEGTHLTLVADDAGRRWSIGSGEPVVLRGNAGDLTAWLAGRAPGKPITAETGTLPELGPWP